MQLPLAGVCPAQSFQAMSRSAAVNTITTTNNNNIIIRDNTGKTVMTAAASQGVSCPCTNLH